MSQETKKQFDKNTLVIILYLIERLSGVLGKTHLQKMLFLIDLLSTKKFKKPLTCLEFQKCHYGPFSGEINDYIEHLESKGFITIKELPFTNNGDKTYTRYYFNNKGTIKKLLQQKLGAENTMLLDDIINSYGNVSLQEILDVVYRLETVKKSELSKPLEMAKIIKEDNNDVEEMDIF